MKAGSMIGLCAVLSSLFLVPTILAQLDEQGRAATPTGTASVPANASIGYPWPDLNEYINYSDDSIHMMEMVNDLRANEGRRPLVHNLELDRLANLRARELEINYSHIRPNGQRVAEFTKSLPSFAGGGPHGENIVDGRPSVETAMEAWTKSPAHRNNMLQPFTAMGVGHHVDRDGCHYWVQLFVTAAPMENENLYQNLAAEVNTQRQKNGFVPLKEDEFLNQAAAIRAMEMRQSPAHARPDGRDWHTIFPDLRLRKKVWGELIMPDVNIPRVYFVAGLKDRPPLPDRFTAELENILGSDFTRMGQAIDVDSRGRRHWVVIVSD